MRVRPSWPALGALLSAGAFGVHQLRYALAYGDGAEHALTASGHGYLTFVGPMVGLALAFALAYAVWRIASGPRPQTAARRRLAITFGLVLLIVYTGQELLEGELAAGHAGGLAGVFGSGGWIAVPAALVMGVLLALAVQLTGAASDAVVFTGVLRHGHPAPPSAPWHGIAVVGAAASSPLAGQAAGRAPPSALSS